MYDDYDSQESADRAYRLPDAGPTPIETDGSETDGGEPVPLDCPANWSRSADSCYLLLATEEALESADAACRGTMKSAHVIVIDSASENLWLASNFAVANSDVLLGLYREGTVWRWVDGSPLDYSNFSAPGNGACATLDADGFWEIVRCNHKDDVLCELEL